MKQCVVCTGTVTVGERGVLVLADDWCLGSELATESRLRLNEETGKVPTIGWAPQLILCRSHAP
jgi:hypothetical protein